MENLLQISPGFWNIDGSQVETTYLEKIRTGEELNVYVSPEMVEAWQNPDGVIDNQTVDSILALISSNIKSCVAYPIDMAERFRLLNGLPCEEVKLFLKERASTRFFIIPFCCDEHWCFLIFDHVSQKMRYITTSTNFAYKITALRAAHNSIFSAVGHVGSIQGEGTKLDAFNTTKARHSLIWCLLAVLRFFDRLETEFELILNFNSNALMLYEIRILYALACQTWVQNQPEAIPEVSIDAPNPPQFLFNTDLFIPESGPFDNLEELSIQFGCLNTAAEIPGMEEPNLCEMDINLNLDLHTDQLANDINEMLKHDLQKLKQQPRPDIVCLERVQIFDSKYHYTDPIHPLVAAVAYLTSNAASCTRDSIILFMSKMFGWEKRQTLPLLTSIFLTPGNIDDTPLVTRPIIQSKEQYFLTRYGFNKYIKNCEIIRGFVTKADEKNSRIRAYPESFKRRGRKQNREIRVEFLEGRKVKKQRKMTPTWIGVVKMVLETLRRPMTSQEVAEYLQSTSHIPISETHRNNIELLKSSVRQAFIHGSKPSGTNDIEDNTLRERAKRAQSFFWLPKFQGQTGIGGLIDNQGNRLYINRVECANYNSEFFRWGQLCDDFPHFKGWVLRRRVCDRVLRGGPDGAGLYTRIDLPANLFIYCRNPDDPYWILQSARHGYNIQFARIGERFYAELHCDFPAGSELNFDRTIPQ